MKTKSTLKINAIRKRNKPCLNGHEHLYQIIRGTGHGSPSPTWQCTRCMRKTKSS